MARDLHSILSIGSVLMGSSTIAKPYSCRVFTKLQLHFTERVVEGCIRYGKIIHIIAIYLRVARTALYLLSLDASSLFFSIFVSNGSFWIELVLLALLWASGEDSPRAAVLLRYWHSSTQEASLVGVLEVMFRLGVDSLKEEKSKLDCSLLEFSASLMLFEEDWEVWSSSVSNILLWMSLFRIGMGLIMGLGVGLWETEFTELEDFDLW